MSRALLPCHTCLQKREELSNHEIEALESFHSGRGWPAFQKFVALQKHTLNQQALDACDGRSLVYFKQMEILSDVVRNFDVLMEKRSKPI